ncbi:hypothetical protein [Companilactobacillus kimchiensis]|uniref:Surface layer protein A domain-containing protein n=1 Tax=Companilactobacillus kimchiensis TaxID=993692 RepID=A0A0R2LGS9_9LACO|nr:hypothetical protein [Companilactobacillus kimchiensis]KRO00774.1 hypothetical protein IV57_GL000094 [Companilactobacillus kimchiensis]
MKNVIKVSIISALALLSLTSITGVTKVKADYIHTFKQESLYARGSVAEIVPDPGAYLYNFSKVYDRALAPNTDWYTDKVDIPVDNAAIPNWRVSTNEWVSSQNVAYVHTDWDATFSIDSPQKIYQFNKDDFSFSDTGRMLDAGRWASNRVIDMPNQTTLTQYRQVATNEWIRLVSGENF